MQSKTSFFNKTVFWKTLSRFWPLWAAYLALWLFLLPMQLASDFHSYASYDLLRVQRAVLRMASESSIIINAFAGILSAMAVWSFLYSSRSAHGMACLPIRREGVFLSVTAAGILPLVAVNVLIALATLGVEALYDMAQLSSILSWLGANTLMLLFFYGFSVFCAQLTGNILVLPCVYVVLNFTAIVVEALVRQITHCFVYGSGMGANIYVSQFLTPIVMMLSNCGLRDISVQVAETWETVGYYYGGWGILSAYALVGILFAVAALFLYRRRRMEAAGDVVAVNVLKPVFKYCLTFGCALVLGYLICYVLFGISDSGMGDMRVLLLLLVCMLIGAFIGYFAAEMLIHKSFRVWEKRKWAGFGGSALLIIVLMFAAELNLFGYETKLPKAEQVDSLMVYAGGETASLEDKDNIQQMLNIHQSIIEDKAHYESLYSQRHDPDREWLSMQVFYNIGDHQVARRYELYYYIDQPESYGDILTLQSLMNTPEAIEKRKETDIPVVAENIISASVEATLPAEVCARLAGYEDVETYILSEYEGLSKSVIEALSDEEKQSMLYDCIERYAYHYEYIEKYADLAVEATSATGIYYPGTAPTAEAGGEIDFDSIRFRYTWPLTPEEAEDLYQNGILSDMSQQTIGKIWLITDETYLESVYDARINIDLRMVDSSGHPDSDGYFYHYFYTVPTVDASRTNLWLSTHGIEMMTLAELNQYSFTK